MNSSTYTPSRLLPASIKTLGCALALLGLLNTPTFADQSDDTASTDPAVISVSQWHGVATQAQNVTNQGRPVMEIIAPGDAYSFDLMPIDATKRYMISGNFRSTNPDLPITLFFDVTFFTADKERIGSLDVGPDTSITHVKTDASKGQNVVHLQKATDWPAKAHFHALAFDAKEDYSDIPNTNTIVVKEIKETADGLTLTLHKPLTADVAASTPVRLHRYVDLPGTNRKAVPAQWTPMNFIILPNMKEGQLAPTVRWQDKKNIWPGAAYVRISIRSRINIKGDKTPADNAPKPAIQFDDIQLILLDRDLP